MAPELRSVALVIIDITGYTEFIRFHRASLLHAQEIVAQLLEAVIDSASHPLVLNKLEGDAAFLYAELAQDDAAGARDIARQVLSFFASFHNKALELSGARAGCQCEACRRILGLRLKAVMHLGVAGFRKIRQFEELTGEDVILVHRLLKNHLAEDEYVLMTEPMHRLAGDLPECSVRTHEETYDVLGSVAIRVFSPGGRRSGSGTFPDSASLASRVRFFDSLRLRIQRWGKRLLRFDQHSWRTS